MKVGIEAGDGVNLAHGNVDFSRECLDLIRRQVAEIALNFPKFLEHDARDSALSDLRSSLA